MIQIVKLVHQILAPNVIQIIIFMKIKVAMKNVKKLMDTIIIPAIRFPIVKVNLYFSNFHFIYTCNIDKELN